MWMHINNIRLINQQQQQQQQQNVKLEVDTQFLLKFNIEKLNKKAKQNNFLTINN
jgi:ribosomal protein L24